MSTRLIFSLSLALMPALASVTAPADDARAQREGVLRLERALDRHRPGAAPETLVLRFEGRLYPASQARSPEPPFDPFPVAEDVRVTADAAHVAVEQRLEWPEFVARHRLVATRDRAFDLDLVTRRALPPWRPPAELRLGVLRRAPALLLERALGDAASVRLVGRSPHEGVELDVVRVTVEGHRLSLWIDDEARLRRVTRMAHAEMRGDALEVTELIGERSAAGLVLPERVHTLTAGVRTSELRLVSAATAPRDADAFALPEAFTSPEDRPPAAPALEPLAEGVWRLERIGGGDYRSLVVERSDHLVLLETPQDSPALDAALRQVEARWPDRPLRWAVPTHHHFDHAGGVRAALARGATLLTTPGNAAFFRRAGRAPHTIRPDVLEGRAADWSVVILSEPTRRLPGDGPVLEIHRLGATVHAEEMLYAWLPEAGILFQGDLFVHRPGTPEPARAQARALLERIEALGLEVRQLVGVHGGIGRLDDLREALRLAGAVAGRGGARSPEPGAFAGTRGETRRAEAR